VDASPCGLIKIGTNESASGFEGGVSNVSGTVDDSAFAVVSSSCYVSLPVFILSHTAFCRSMSFTPT
jgi:hypothetical protein